MIQGFRVIVAVGVAFGCAGAAHAAGDMEGKWARGDGIAQVKVEKCGGNVCATNTWIKPGTASEKAGDVLVMTIKPVSSSKFSGSAFDPQRNLNYKISVTVNGDRMTTKGCVLGGLLCKNVGWTRMK